MAAQGADDKRTNALVGLVMSYIVAQITDTVGDQAGELRAGR